MGEESNTTTRNQVMTIQVGDKVRFSSRFIQSVQGHEIAPLRGVVKEIIRGKTKQIPDRAAIDWGDEGESRALVSNLTKVKS